MLLQGDIQHNRLCETMWGLFLAASMKRFPGFPIVVVGLFIVAGCGNPGPGDDLTGQEVVQDAADAVDPDTNVTPDIGDHDETPLDTAGADESGADAGDAVQDDAIPDDTDDDADAPHPAEVFQPIYDRTFGQEINHTGIEVDRRITNIVDVITKPAWAPAAFEDVVIVTTAGYWFRNAPLLNPEAVEGSHLVAADVQYGPVIGAGFGLDSLIVVQRDAIVLYWGDPADPTVELVANSGPYTKVTGGHGWTLITDGHNVWSVSAAGLLPVGDFTESGFEITAMTINRDWTVIYVGGVLENGDSRIEKWNLAANGSASDNPGSVTLAGIGLQALVTNIGIPDEMELVVAGTGGVAGFTTLVDNAVPLNLTVFQSDRVPLTGATDIARTADEGFIVTTNGGAYRMIDRGDGPEWRFYNTLRWVADNDVRAVATTPADVDSPIYFGSAAGLTWATVENMTIEDKMGLMREKIEIRHDRDGAVADSHLMVPGDLSTNIPWDSDNDGGWTCYWIIAECMRWKETEDPQAKINFDKSLQAMLNLRLLTGEDWFLARSLIRKDGCRLDDCDDPNDGEWYTSPDGEWWVKSDTSNDEVTSHLFMMGPAYDLCADETQKHAIAAHVSNIIGGIIDHGYQLWKPTGECTTYGQFDPEYVNFFGLFGDGGQRSVQMLAGLNLSIYMTQDQESKGTTTDLPPSQKFMDAKTFLMNDDNHYDDNVLVSTEPPGRHGNGDGDELSTQAFFILVQYEPDALLKAKWLEGWNRVYHYLHMQQDAVWDAIHGVITGTVPEMYTGERWYRVYPMDLIRWNIHNSHRLDLIPAPDFYLEKDPARRMRSDGRIIPADERPNDRHNTSQFTIEGGWGDTVEMDSGDVQAAYWMSRHYGFILQAE